MIPNSGTGDALRHPAKQHRNTEEVLWSGRTETKDTPLRADLPIAPPPVLCIHSLPLLSHTPTFAVRTETKNSPLTADLTISLPPFLSSPLHSLRHHLPARTP